MAQRTEDEQFLAGGEDEGSSKSERWSRYLPTLLRIAWPALLVLGVATVIGAVLVSLEATGHKEGLDQITATGQVRAPVAEISAITHSYDELDALSHARLRDDLRSTMRDAESAHQSLMAASKVDLSQFFEQQARLERVDTSLELAFERMQAALEALEALDRGEQPHLAQTSREALALLGAASRQYLLVLDHIDLHVANSAQDKLARLQIYEAGVIAVAGLLLVVLALWVIRPSHQLIDRQIKQLKASRGTLAESVIAAEKVALSRERLVYALSHDVRAPLQAILLNVELARHQQKSAAKDEALERVARGAQRVKALIDELLSKGAKLEESELSRIEVDKLVEEIAAMYRPQAHQRGLALDVDLESHLPAIFGRKEALSRVLENLVTNAIKYTERGGVTIRAQSKAFDNERYVGIDVADTGPGLSDEEVERSLEEGGRLNLDEEGHGLGLAIVQRLVNQELFGELIIESTVGQGSTFSVVLPLAAAGGLTPSAWRPDAFLERLRDTRAFEDLVAVVVGQAKVEDEVRKLGAQVVEVSSEEVDMLDDFWEPAKQADLIFFDADQLAEGGCSLCDSLRQHEFAGPLVGLYSDAISVDRDGLFRSGCDALLRKPADAIDLVEWLARALTYQSQRIIEAA